MAVGDKTYTGATETKAERETTCKTCKRTIAKGETCYFNHGFNGKNTYCEDCEGDAIARKMERETENFIDSNFY